MKDVAKAAGVSQATVSRVISGNTSVDPEIKAKVMKWIRKLDYQPNIIAQSLVGNKTLLIGVIITDISNPFFSDIIKSVEREAANYGYSIMLFNTDGDIEKEKKYINILKSYKVEGILIVPSDAKNKYFKTLQKSSIPIVIITQDIKNFNCVSISHYMGGKKVAKHLVDMGYSKFVFVGYQDDEKELGFKEELENSGFDLNNKYMFIDKGKNNHVAVALKEFIINNLDDEGIGIFTHNDIEALMVLHLLKELKIKIPEKAALVGFDNTYITKEVSPSISSVAQLVEEIGRKAVEILIDKINEREKAEEKHIILEPRLVVRESSVKLVEY
ncbi:LacI family DNA-binding transcriptional regulator [Clostridium sp. 19966]|uniref:LacI family DNA-binding transcriptional regulator n=1 Tax=Clostridium sp. 19966 TaxID=2768166 RepID=UPI0028E8D489|nr:LacI family DNA-binding transcriptional regulator [Clostridium sp. 19966]